MTDKPDQPPEDAKPQEPAPTADQPPAAGEPAAESSADQPAAQFAADAPPPPAGPPPVPPQPKRPPHLTRTWIAAVVAGVLLLGGGIGGYFIGAANDRDGHPGWHDRSGPRDGFGGNFGDFRDGPRDGPWYRDGDR